jgi:hypothetical protein
MDRVKCLKAFFLFQKILLNGRSLDVCGDPTGTVRLNVRVYEMKRNLC